MLEQVLFHGNLNICSLYYRFMLRSFAVKNYRSTEEYENDASESNLNLYNGHCLLHVTELFSNMKTIIVKGYLIVLKKKFVTKNVFLLKVFCKLYRFTVFYFKK